jgi:hypothetical protein
MKFLVLLITLLYPALCTEATTETSTEPSSPAKFEYLVINSAAVFLSGILLAQVALVSERWLLFASVPLVVTGLVFFVVDNRLRAGANLMFLRGRKTKRLDRPWIDVMSVVAWPEETIVKVDQ